MYKTALLIGLAVSVLFAVTGNSELLRRFEHVGYDLSVALSLKRPASNKVVVVAIDDKAIEHYGAWPWNRDILAAAQRRINEGGPGVVGYTLSFEAPHNERGLQIMGEFRDENLELMNRTLVRRFQQAVNRLDSDHQLAAAFRGSPVVLGLPYRHGRAPEENPVPERLEPHTLTDAPPPGFEGGLASWPAMFRPPAARPVARFYLPTEKIGGEAAGWAGGEDYLSNVHGSRALPLILPVGERYLPSLPLLVTALLEGRSLRDIELVEGEGVRLGTHRIPTDNAGRVYPYFYKPTGAGEPFRMYSIRDVLEREVPYSAFKDKAVLVGLTAPRFSELHPTPLGEPMAPVELLGHAVSSLLQNDLYRITGWSNALRYAGIALVALYLMLLLPRLGNATGLAVSVLVAVLLLNVEVIVMLTRSVWAPMMLSVATLIGGHILIAANRAMYARVHSYKEALTESNLQLGQTLQSQGRLDQAFAKYRHCVAGEEVLAALYGLGEDYERKRQFKKAAEVFGYIAARRRRYRDVETRIRKNEQLDKTLVLGGDNRGTATQTLILTGDDIQKPVLGRYEVEKELGRGAMGMVYLGRDPKIGRTVAIKTMSFAQEFDEEDAEEIKQRFQREAKTAGRLNHPNIVTIYDVGEEQDLSYIAMDYLEGEPLSKATRDGQLLPATTVLDIAAQVADALHYAHGEAVVHRDIKPENIIYNDKTGKATVTDFGVACLTNASTTKTGVVLGSPSYMSPEQLSGKKLDGRSDLFSLGVTLFQLLTGKLPFTADTLSSLMYKIANDKHPDIRKIRGDLPQCVATIVNRALQKNAEKRYADGNQMAAAIRRCKKNWDSN